MYINVTQDARHLWGPQPATWVRKWRDRYLQTDGVLIQFPYCVPFFSCPNCLQVLVT